MDNFLYVLFLSWVVFYADFKMTKHNWGAIWNGLGAIPSVLQGTALAPMQYRVLVPWICRLLGATNTNQINLMRVYLLVRLLAILSAEFAAFIYFETMHIDPFMGISLLSFYFIWAALYDYTDVYFEIAFFATAFCIILNNNYSNVYAVYILILSFVASLNRETAIFIPVTCLLSGWLIGGLVGIVGFLGALGLLRWRYGAKKRYCNFIMIKNNIQTIKEHYGSDMPILMNEYSHFFFLTLVVAVLYLTQWLFNSLNPIEISMGIMYVLLLIPTMWREIRVFAPVMLSIIPIILR